MQGGNLHGFDLTMENSGEALTNASLKGDNFMSTMQEFYTRLFQAPEMDNPAWASLIQLTQVSVHELTPLESGLLGWTDWGGWD